MRKKKYRVQVKMNPTIILDCIDEEDIAEIVTDKIQGIIQRDDSAMMLSPVAPEDEDIDSENIEENSDEETTKVVLGCKIFASDAEGAVKTFAYKYINGVMPQMLKAFEGKSVGDIVTVNAKDYIIESISIS